jgi:hypothetical protein
LQRRDQQANLPGHFGWIVGHSYEARIDPAALVGSQLAGKAFWEMTHRQANCREIAPAQPAQPGPAR